MGIASVCRGACGAFYFFMKQLLSFFAAATALCLLAGCGELGPESEAAQEEQLNRAVSVPGVLPSDSLGYPDQPAVTRVPGE